MRSTSKLGKFSDHVEIAMMYHCVTVSLIFYGNDSIKIKTDIISKDIKLLWSYMETNNLTLMTVLKIFASLFPLQIWQKMKHKGNFKHDKGMNQKLM